MCDPILVTLLKMQPIIVNPVVKMRPHTAAHPHQPLIKKYPPWEQRPPWGQKKVAVVERFNKSQCIDMFDLITTKTRFDQW